MKIYILLIMAVAAALFVSGCTMEDESILIETTPEVTVVSQTPSPVETKELTPENTEPPEDDSITGWIADGVIEEGEYENEITGFKHLFYIYWTSDNETLFMGMKGKTTGWIAVGFNPTVGMGDADIVLGGTKGVNGETYIYDMYSIGTYGPHPPDTQLGGNFSLDEYGAHVENAFTTVEFSRKLDTGDKYDSILAKGESAKVLWSLSYSDAIELKHNAGTGSVEIII